MSFIYNYFTCDNSTPSEKENATTFKAIIKSHKTALKSEIKQYETDCKQALKEAEAEYRHAKKQAEETMFRQTLDAVNREIEVILATDEYKGSDERTKVKIAQFQSWVGCAGMWYYGAGWGGDKKEQEQEMVEKEVLFDEKHQDQEQQGLPSYQDDTSYTSEKDVLLSA